MVSPSDEPVDALLGRMEEASSAAAAGTSRRAVAGHAGLGFWGWRAPGFYAGRRTVVTLDGFFYNREELGAAATDAELLASLYEKHGFAEALRRVNGDFAVALYDARDDTLWLGRDRFGLKPLYYASTPERFAFASRPRALLTLPGVSGAPNRQFVALFAGSHYRVIDNQPDRSPYAAVAQLEAAHLLCVSPGGVRKERYWALADLPDFEDSEEVLAERYRDLLLDAVARRVRVHTRPAFTLSGGMDSSSVLACAVNRSGRRQHAFSTVYEDATYDESAEIRGILQATVEAWHPLPVGNPDVGNVVRRMVEAHDEPVATATWLSHYCLCEQAGREGFGCLFGGLGGDELNAGEYEYFFYFFADLAAARQEGTLAHETAKWVEYHDHPVFRKSSADMRDGLARLVDLARPGRCLVDRSRLLRYQAALNPDSFDLAAFEPVMDHPFRSYLKNRTYQDIYRETAPCCLRAADRQATAFGLDVCWPFFDHRLVEFMFRIPATQKIRGGVTKHLLRLAMRGILPEETRTRVKKTGWNAPAHVWFTGPGRDFLLDLVRSRSFRERGIYNVAEVLRLIEEHERIVSTGAVRENHMMFLWQLANLELWLQSLATPQALAA
jgi:asparagine synthase (glutamine-hydrolysing)